MPKNQQGPAKMAAIQCQPEMNMTEVSVQWTLLKNVANTEHLSKAMQQRIKCTKQNKNACYSRTVVWKSIQHERKSTHTVNIEFIFRHSCTKPGYKWGRENLKVHVYTQAFYLHHFAVVDMVFSASLFVMKAIMSWNEQEIVKKKKKVAINVQHASQNEG